MAPVAPMGRAKVIELVTSGDLPIWIGSPHPQVMVVEQDGLLRLRELVIDRAEAEAAQSSAMRSRSPSWMPEHYYALGRPTGKIYAEAPTRAQLAELIRAMTWPETW